MRNRLSKIAVLTPAIGWIATAVVVAPGPLAQGLIQGVCWFCLVYGIIATKEFRRGMGSVIALVYIWAAISFGHYYFGNRSLAIVSNWSGGALAVGLILMAVLRTPKASDEAAAGEGERRYYIMLNDEVGGPHSFRELVLMQRDKTISKQTLCCIEGSEEWIPFSEV
jgi:hypothetical protein